MTYKLDCTHPEFNASVTVNRLADSGQFVADVQITCADCGEPFRFLGCEAGVRFDKPTVSASGLELHLPIEPQGIPQVAQHLTFQIPKKATPQ